jgi:hypothetical protein
MNNSDNLSTDIIPYSKPMNVEQLISNLETEHPKEDVLIRYVRHDFRINGLGRNDQGTLFIAATDYKPGDEFVNPRNARMTVGQLIKELELFHCDMEVNVVLDNSYNKIESIYFTEANLLNNTIDDDE